MIPFFLVTTCPFMQMPRSASKLVARALLSKLPAMDATEKMTLPPTIQGWSSRGRLEHIKQDCPQFGELSQSQRIPRPPNAFILFRSDLLKKEATKKCPPHQQTLSRLAGEMWNLLPPDQKQEWKDRAKKQSELHRQQYPYYSFKPARRSRKAKSRVPMENSEDYIRSLREAHFGDQFKGPSIRPSRKGKEAPTRQGPTDPATPAPSTFMPTVDMQCYTWATAQLAPNESPLSTPAISPLDGSYYSSFPPTQPSYDGPPPVVASYDHHDISAPLPSFFPQHTYQHFGPPQADPPCLEAQRIEAPRRPSTSLGFINRYEQAASFNTSIGFERPASAAGFVRDVPFSFGSISMPTTPGIRLTLDDEVDSLVNPPFYDEFDLGDLNKLPGLPDQQFIDPHVITNKSGATTWVPG
ncbi:HMG box domain-containing protein [Mycena indigotica]|uniref:HMG box domain-containing protein n=1 Tax=Mycena indigotica TaxID=2126181 RepID=A0A8H6SKK1_9AGAR|nr:HMG box domain-containing protein [Mycena indigotica]KAF7301318.1 HMG box domain-containing protein [Mycena indigotica]